MAAGQITVELLAKTGSFETDTARAGKSLNKLQKDAENLKRAFQASFAGNLAASFTKDILVGLGSIPGRLVDFVKSSIDVADHLNDLSKKTGIAVETLGGIGFAAKQSGLDLDSVATAAGKLNKSLAEAAAGNEQAGEAFKLLGIDVKDAAGNTKTADVVLAEIADKFANFKDGPEKAALALRIFGKAGADIIPLLDEGGQKLRQNVSYFERYGGISKETASKADEFNDTLVKLKLLSDAAGQSLAAELSPSLQAIADEFVKSKEQGGAYTTVIAAIRVAFETVSVLGSDVAFVLTQIAKGFGAVAEAAVKVAKLDFSGAKTIFTEYNKQAAEARANLDAFQAKVLGVQEKIGGGRGLVNPAFAVPEKAAPPRLKSGNPAGPDTFEQELKRKLEGVLRDIRNTTDQQINALQFANRFLEGEYQDGIVSLENFYEHQKNIRARALQVQLDEQQKIIDAESAFAKKTTNPANRIDAENKIQDAIFKREQLTIKAGQEEQLALQQHVRDVDALTKAYDGVNAQVLDLAENFSKAAAIKFDLQFDALSKTFSANGNKAGLQAIAVLREATVRQAEFQKATLETSRTRDDLANAEDRIAISIQTGARTSLDAIIAVGKARRDQIPALEAQVAAEEAIAKAARDAGELGAATLTRNAEKARIELEKLKAAADPLAESLNKTFGDDFNSALDDFVTGTKNAADAFKSFTKSVLNDILKLGSKSISEAIFGGSGGIGGFISDLFKNSNAAPGGLIGAFKRAIGIGTTSAGGLGESAGVPTEAAVNEITKLFQDTGATAARAAETAAITASAASVTASAVAYDAAALSVTTLATAAASASAALAAMAATSSTSSGSDLLAGFASVAGISGGRAEGGPVLAGQTYVVGERGPELLHLGSTSGNVSPNGWGGKTQNIVVNVQGAPNQSRDSAMQQGAAIGLGIQRALARNT